MPQEVTFHDDLVVLQNYLKELVEQLKVMNAFNQAGLTAGQLEHLPKSATEFDILNSIPDSKVPHIIRGDSDRVYVLEKRWVRNPETLEKLGFTFADVMNVPSVDFIRYREGSPLDLKDTVVEAPKKIIPPPIIKLTPRRVEVKEEDEQETAIPIKLGNDNPSTQVGQEVDKPSD